MDLTHATEPGSMPNCARRFMEADAASFAKPAKTRARRRAPLDARQRALAAQWAEYAYSLARPFARQWPRLEDEFLSAATWGLHKAAEGFDPTRGVHFPAYAEACITSEIRAVFKADRPKGYRRDEFADDRPTVGSLAEVDPSAPTTTHEAEVEDREIVGVVLARLEPTLAEVLRARHLEGKRQAEIAAERGVSRQAVQQLESRAAEKARTIIRSINAAG